MKIRSLLFCIMFLTGISSPLISQAGIPRLFLAVIANSNGTTPENIKFNAYITDRPTDIQTESKPGYPQSYYKSGYIVVNLGNFSGAWNTGETLMLEITNIGNCQQKTFSKVIPPGKGDWYEEVMLPEIVPGDYNADGVCDTNDIILAIKIMAGISVETCVNIKADTDAQINLADIIYLLGMVVNQ